LNNQWLGVFCFVREKLPTAHFAKLATPFSAVRSVDQKMRFVVVFSSRTPIGEGGQTRQTSEKVFLGAPG